MKKTFLLLLLSLIINSLNAQKILRSTWTEVYNQFKVDPDVYNMTTGGSGGSYIIHLTYKNREKYSFTFSQVNNKLYGMTLICIDDNTTILRFNAEKEISFYFFDRIPSRGMGFYFQKLQVELGGTPHLFSKFTIK